MFRSSELHERAGAYAAGLLHLAAAPVFAAMALLTTHDMAADMICSAQGGSMLGGMVPMYLLMSLFHCGPWLRLVTGKGNAREA